MSRPIQARLGTKLRTSIRAEYDRVVAALTEVAIHAS